MAAEKALALDVYTDFFQKYTGDLVLLLEQAGGRWEKCSSALLGSVEDSSLYLDAC